jgi:hypothetical protein
MKPFKIKFKNCTEIWHGSPYNRADLIHTYHKNIKLDYNNDWQDKISWSPNNEFLVLVRWKIIEADPGFSIILLNTKTGEMTESKRIRGCCESINLNDDLFVNYEIFTLIDEGNQKIKYGLKNDTMKITF